MKYTLQEAFKELRNSNKKLNEEFNNKEVDLVIVSEDLLDDLKKALRQNKCKLISAYRYFSEIFVFYTGDLNDEFIVNDLDYLAESYGLDLDDLEEALDEGKLEEFITDEIDTLEPTFIDIEEPLNYYILSYYDEENDETYYASDDVEGYTTSEVDAYHFKEYELDDAIYNFADDLNVGRSEIKVISK